MGGQFCCEQLQQWFPKLPRAKHKRTQRRQQSHTAHCAASSNGQTRNWEGTEEQVTELETSNSTWLHSLYYHLPQESLCHAEGPQPHCSFLLQSPFQNFKEPCCLVCFIQFQWIWDWIESKGTTTAYSIQEAEVLCVDIRHKAINASSSCSFLLS